MIEGATKRKLEKISKGELDDLKDMVLKDKDDDVVDEIEELYEDENDESSEDSEASDVDSLEDSDDEREKKDEFEDGDTSDEEDRKNTIGNVPIEWYDHLPHIGYDLDGKKIAKPIKNKDEIDDFLARCEDPDYWRTITDRSTLRDHKLTPEEVDFIKRLTKGEYAAQVDDTPEWIDLYSHEVEEMPINRAPESKASFVPSKDERNKVNKLAMLIRRGIIKTKSEREREAKEKAKPKYFNVWSKQEELEKSRSQISREKMAFPAPKLPLPGHAESYRPAPEFLFDESETLAWEGEDPEDRKQSWMPKHFSNLRTVPAYADFYKERFERCLDLYLAPRQRKMKMNVKKEDLIPKLPSPKDLQPFPTFQALTYKGHVGMVRSISAHPSGQFLASCGDDGTARVWEIASGRCLRLIKLSEDEKCLKVSWSPNPNLCLLIIGFGNKCAVVNPQVGDKRIVDATNDLIDSWEEPEEYRSRLNWSSSTVVGAKLIIDHLAEVRDVAWHSKGDYFACVAGTNAKTTVYLHQLSTRKTQLPFTSAQKNVFQKITFHPTRPLFYLATQRYVKVWNLAKQEMQRKLEPNVKWVSSIAVHKTGDHVLVGDFSTRLAWIDLDLSQKPFKTLRYHKKAIRSCKFHNRYPLFASGSDDGTIIVSHGRVYNDLSSDPLIVPVKVLKGIKTTKNFGVMDVEFHPNHPWVFGAGVDGSIRLYT